MKKIFILTGEPSGDKLAYTVISKLRQINPNIEYSCVGGTYLDSLNIVQPKIGFKTRYGLVANPFAEGTDQGLGALRTNSNRYYRRVAVKNLM